MYVAQQVTLRNIFFEERRERALRQPIAHYNYEGVGGTIEQTSAYGYHKSKSNRKGRRWKNIILWVEGLYLRNCGG